MKEDDLEVFTREWRPWTVVSPHEGEYTLKVELLDKNGNAVPGPFTTVTRTFQESGGG